MCPSKTWPPTVKDLIAEGKVKHSELRRFDLGRLLSCCALIPKDLLPFFMEIAADDNLAGHWLDEFYWWLEAHGLTKKSK